VQDLGALGDLVTHAAPLDLVAYACAAASATILIVYLIRKPGLSASSRLWLLLGLGVFPIGLAGAGNVQGYEATKQRAFCGSCHVMIPHAQDSNDPKSLSLASRHGRNKLFGEENCYMCHADYGMYGTITTKIGGMHHVYAYLKDYRNVPLEEAKKTIHLYAPYPNDNCMHCHSTELDIWNRQPDHKASLDAVRAGKISCASGGCHGFAHPFTKPAEDVKKADEERRERMLDAGADR
jgi:nitrate/TMAO reductase-like tetraheme cytochrome c subunit